VTAVVIRKTGVRARPAVMRFRGTDEFRRSTKVETIQAHAENRHYVAYAHTRGGSRKFLRPNPVFSTRTPSRYRFRTSCIFVSFGFRTAPHIHSRDTFSENRRTVQSFNYNLYRTNTARFRFFFSIKICFRFNQASTRFFPQRCPDNRIMIYTEFFVFCY